MKKGQKAMLDNKTALFVREIGDLSVTQSKHK